MAGLDLGALKRVQIPRMYTLMRWTFLVIIAVSTALVGFFQSMLVSWLYKLRSNFIESIVMLHTNMFAKFFQYAGFNLLLAFGCSFTLYLISPAASGSGIPDVKAYLNGVESPAWAQFFTVKTFVAKVICSALAVSSSLIMGKEGPMLHAGSILAVLLGSNKWMQQQMQVAAHWGSYTYNKDERDLVAVGAACGVCTAFKAPVGGVMFAMEMATRWSKELTYKTFLAVAITILVVREAVTVCGIHGHCQSLKWGSLIWFKINFPTPYLQVWAIVLLAIIGGYLGCLFTSFNTWVCLVRKKWAKHIHLRILEVCLISIATSIIFFFMPVAGRCKSCDSKFGDECKTGDTSFKTFQGFHCHAEHHYNDLATLVFNPQGFVTQALFTADSGVFSLSSLALYSLFYWLMACITYGAFIPSGLFTPSLIFGGCFGRMFAEVLVMMGVASNNDVGLYALLGGAAFLGGLMRMSAAQALILMEMTQSPAQLPFLMLVLVVSKNVGDAFNYSVFDHQMMLKSLPFVGIAESNTKRFHINAVDVMKPNEPSAPKCDTLFLVESGKVLADALEKFKDIDAFPVVTRPSGDDDDLSGGKGFFCGMISRRGIAELLEKHTMADDNIDLSAKVEVAPLVIPPSMPLPFIYRMVNAEGFNYVPVIRYHGPLEGIVSRKELVDVQNQKLDAFHLKEQIERMDNEIQQGKIIGSMQLGDNIHAQAFRRVFQHPLAAMREVLEKDDKPEAEQQTFYMDAAAGGGAGDASTSGFARHPGMYGKDVQMRHRRSAMGSGMQLADGGSMHGMGSGSGVGGGGLPGSPSPGPHYAALPTNDDVPSPAPSAGLAAPASLSPLAGGGHVEVDVVPEASERTPLTQGHSASDKH